MEDAIRDAAALMHCSSSSNGSPLEETKAAVLSPNRTAANNDAEADADAGVILHVKWGGKCIDLFFTFADYETFSVLDLKTKILTELNIPLHRQKLLGIHNKETLICDSDMITDLTFKKSHTFWLVGTPAEKSFVEPSCKNNLPEVVNDLAWDYDPSETSAKSIRTEVHLRRLRKAIEKTNITIIHPPRPQKKLLVLDLDYTLFDFKGESLNIPELKRPYLEYFMVEAYREYDLAIWSQTHWRWVEVKCTELGFLSSSLYSLSFVLDRSSMFSISSQGNGGTMVTHEVKALELIWAKFPGRWGPHNTLHIDDSGKNFALNPRNGIKVQPYRVSRRFVDKELLELTDYLKVAATLSDVRLVDHSDWRAVARLKPNSHEDAAP